MSLVPAGAAQPTLVAQLPRDSAVLRRQLAERAPLLECERSLVTDNLMRLAAIDPEYCPESSDSDACYLLSQDALLGSIRSLECLALRREHKQRNLPAFHHWGFLSPACWSYVEVRRRAFRSPQLAPPEPRLARLALEAAQEWAHPDDPKLRGALRLAVLGRCLPFLLDDLPHQLAQGQVRHDAVSTTVTRLRAGARAVEETRRVSVVGRVVVDARSADALAAARHQHAAALNPLVVGAAEAAEPGGRWGGDGALGREQRLLRRRIKQGALVLLLNVGVIGLNIVVICRGMWIWRLIQQLQLVEWVHRIQPHFPVTMRAMRILDWGTLPLRRLLAPLVQPLVARVEGAAAAAEAGRGATARAARATAAAGSSSRRWRLPSIFGG